MKTNGLWWFLSKLNFVACLTKKLYYYYYWNEARRTGQQQQQRNDAPDCDSTYQCSRLHQPTLAAWYRERDQWWRSSHPPIGHEDQRSLHCPRNPIIYRPTIDLHSGQSTGVQEISGEVARLSRNSIWKSKCCDEAVWNRNRQNPRTLTNGLPIAMIKSIIFKKELYSNQEKACN